MRFFSNSNVQKQSKGQRDKLQQAKEECEINPIQDLEECYRTALSYSIAALNAEKAQDLLAALGNYRRAISTIEQCKTLNTGKRDLDLFSKSNHLPNAIEKLNSHCRDHMSAVAVVVAAERHKEHKTPTTATSIYMQGKSMLADKQTKPRNTFKQTLRKSSQHSMTSKCSSPAPQTPPKQIPPPHVSSDSRSYSSSALYDQYPALQRPSNTSLSCTPAENASRAAILAWKPYASPSSSSTSVQQIPDSLSNQLKKQSYSSNRPYSDSCNSLNSIDSNFSSSERRYKEHMISDTFQVRQSSPLIPAEPTSKLSNKFPIPPLPPRSCSFNGPIDRNETTEMKSDMSMTNKEVIALSKCKSIDQELGKTILNEIVSLGEEVTWEDIAGLDSAKSALKEAVVYPFLRPDLFKGLREPARGMLLFGPPGTGKTMLAKAVAFESKSTFFQISSSSLTSKFLGDSEKLVRALFTLAKEMQPSIIFVDEIDSLLSARSDSGTEHETSRRLKTEFLIQWSSLARATAAKDNTEAPRVLVLAATNLPWLIDEAARRRFVRRQYIPLPESKTRKDHIKSLLQFQRHLILDRELDWLVEATEGYSGSDITSLTKDAAMGPLRELGENLLTTQQDLIRPIKLEDFRLSLKSIKPSVSKAGLSRYDKWNEDFGAL